MPDATTIEPIPSSVNPSTSATDALPSMRRVVLAVTMFCAGLGALAVACFLLAPGWYGGVGATAAAIAAGAAFFPAAGGWIALERQRRLQTGEPDLYLQCNESRSETAVMQGRAPLSNRVRRAVARYLCGHRHLVGDPVRIKPLATIRATLDVNGELDGMPFLDEMAAFCGQEGTVFRVVDKIYDYGRSRLMRRLDDCVLITGLRCDGAAHGGCQAACYLIWKAAWLESASKAAAEPPAVANSLRARAAKAPAPYRCQYTELTEASTPMAAMNLVRLFGPWIVGNVSGRAFRVALLTRAFNALQALRGGPCYPWLPAGGNDKSVAGTPLRRGDWVRVRSSSQIARTLDRNSKHKGLWFDRDMLKHCGSVRRVRGRVDKIIDINTRSMITMKTPCIVLEGVHYSGEFQGFGEQHDFLYWREAWLESMSDAGRRPPDAALPP